MPLERWHRYTREQIQANPATLFLFGDNMQRSGYGGQAKEARGEPNAVGVPTKWFPHMGGDAFFKDADLERVRPSIQAGFKALADHLKAGGTVALPADGIGTDRARLREKAPKVADYIDRCMKHLETFE